MKDLQIFENEEFGKVRTITVDNEPWFVGKDVCAAFGDTDHKRSLSRLDDCDKSVSQIHTPGGLQPMVIINESGLYALMFAMQPQKGGAQDDPPTKKRIEQRIEKLQRFKHWVTHEVLPSIRKHGMYATDDLLNDPDLAIKAFTALKEERERNKLLQSENEAMKPKALFADAVAASQTTILIGDLAKLIKQNGIEIGQKRLFSWLRKNGYLIKGGSDYNMPTQRSMQLGLFEIKESTSINPDGSTRINRTTKVTGKGQQYFINKFLGQKQMQQQA